MRRSDRARLRDVERHGHRRARRSKVRCVGYQIETAAPHEHSIDESGLEKLLEAALLRGVIFQFDTGRGWLTWFNGWPGKRLRALRAQVEAEVVRARRAAGLAAGRPRSLPDSPPART